MRDLTIKQKILLDDLHKRLECRKVEHISNNDWEKLKEINDTEVLYQNVNYYLDELTSKKLDKYL